MAILSLNETTTFRWSFEDDVAHYAAAGIEAIGVWRQKLSDCGQDRALELIRQHHLRFRICSGRGGSRAARGTAIAKAWKTRPTPCGRPRPWGRLPGGVQRRQGRPHLQPCPATRPGSAQGTGAAGRGVRRGDGPGADAPGLRAQCTFLNNLDDALGIIQAIDRPHVKLLLDTYHLGQDPGLVERIPQIASQIALVQLGDAKCPPQGEQNRCRLGDGVVPLRQIVCALRRAGYDGFFDVELLGEDIEAIGLSRTVGARQGGIRRSDGTSVSGGYNGRCHFPEHGLRRCSLSPANCKSRLRNSKSPSPAAAGRGGRTSTRSTARPCCGGPFAAAPALPEAVRERFLQKYGSRLTTEGELLVTSQRYRDAPRNSQDCLEKLRAMLLGVVHPPKRRRATRPTRGSVERRLQGKRRQSAAKQNRRLREE